MRGSQLPDKPPRFSLLLDRQLSIQRLPKRQFPPAEKHLLLTLVLRLGSNDGCWPSQQTLSLETGYGERRIRDLLWSLAAKKVITSTRTAGTNYYTIEWLRIADIISGKVTVPRTAARPARTKPQMSPVTPCHQPGVPVANQPGLPVADRPVLPVADQPVVPTEVAKRNNQVRSNHNEAPNAPPCPPRKRGGESDISVSQKEKPEQTPARCLLGVAVFAETEAAA